MRSRHGILNIGALTLGSVNLALVSLYFIPVWGRDAIKVLISPYHGLEQRVHAAATIYVGELFNLGFSGFAVTSSVLAGVKLVIAAAFVAYFIEFARAWVMGRPTDPETTDVVLILAAVGVVLCALPAALGAPTLMPLSAAQTSLVAGAIMVISVERRIAAAAETSRDTGLAVQVGSRSPVVSSPMPAVLAHAQDAHMRGA
jgi:hypothetical protein